MWCRGWCLYYDLGRYSAGFRPTSLAVPVLFPAQAGPPPHRSCQDPGREKGLLLPPCWLGPRRTQCISVLEMFAAGAAPGQPPRGQSCTGGSVGGQDWTGGQALRGDPGHRAQGRRVLSLLLLPIPHVGGGLTEKLAPQTGSRVEGVLDTLSQWRRSRPRSSLSQTTSTLWPAQGTEKMSKSKCRESNLKSSTGYH